MSNRGVKARERAAELIFDRLHFLLPEHHIRLPGPAGWIYLDLSESVMMVKRALWVYEYWTRHLISTKSVLGPGMTAIDIGANKGDYSLLFARLVGDGGTVLAFEPDPRNRVWLERSIKANHYKRIRVSEFALAEGAGTATFYPGVKSGWGSLAVDRRGTDRSKAFDVPTQALDALAELWGFQEVDLIKVDVEGTELAVLRGAKTVLSTSPRITLILDVDSSSSDERGETYELLRSCGLNVWTIGPRLQPASSFEDGRRICASKLVLGPLS